MSYPPPSFYPWRPGLSADERLDELFAWVRAMPRCYPFFWIDPIDGAAVEQVDLALRRGVRGFKVICDRFYPSDERAMRTFQAIADRDRPILFHSGILWDGKVSARYNRPAEFEALLEVRGLRFALAHISWPWCDEMIAVFGKILNAHGHGVNTSGGMFVDTTPGTPAIYRRDALTRLFGSGYDATRSVLFGSDGKAADYDDRWTREWIERDTEIYRSLGLSDARIADIMGGNLIRFVEGGRA